MQILEIVLYGRNGGKRVLPLRPGQVNIITGQSHTGKTSLIPIVSYCLGGSAFNVPEGRVVQSVAWFGVLIEAGGGKMFVARENPFPMRASTSTAYLLRAVDESPLLPPDAANISIEALEDILSSVVGILPNLQSPPATSTRPPLAANIRHALIYCFQHQTEIANNQVLFHRQATEFLTAAIKETLPYFLGAVQEEELALEEQLSTVRRKIKLLEIQQQENQQIEGVGVSKAAALLQEAVSVGLIDDRQTPQAMRDARQLLSEAVAWSPGRAVFVGADELSLLQDDVAIIKEQRAKLADIIHAARAMSGEAQGFTDEARVQAERLESIGLFDDFDHSACPVCAQHLSTPLPPADAIRQSLEQLRNSLAQTERERPRLREYIEERNRELAQLTERQAEKEQAIITLQNQEEAAQQMRDLNSRRAKVVGRISLYLESVPTAEADDTIQRQLAAARVEAEQLGQRLDPVQKDQRLKSILNRINQKMTDWAATMDLEFRTAPVRLDLSALTIFVDTETRAIPLVLLGAGENWLAYHLLVHLALHRHFRQANRPVPAFLFLDQPTQVYFPPDTDPYDRDVDQLADDDRHKVARMLKLIFDVAAELAPGLQIIVTDHADLRREGWFQEAVVEKWRGEGNALVPGDW